MSWWEYLVIFAVALASLYVLYGLGIALFFYVLTKWWY